MRICVHSASGALVRSDILMLSEDVWSRFAVSVPVHPVVVSGF